MLTCITKIQFHGMEILTPSSSSGSLPHSLSSSRELVNTQNNNKNASKTPKKSYIIKCKASKLSNTLDTLRNYVTVDSIFSLQRNEDVMLLIDLDQQQALSVKLSGLEISIDDSVVKLL